ncbi:hypothetical protein [Halapricum salinum]|uniref:DUF7847 domain-containing protein n=1 Tax=Halapricum salinum TaxID=1457250 RepID=A0A4D6H8N5_9EURY|nr:hypothetical protein [Halapricum salinum]QCC50243.1 hypothetical protein DV733_02895 [Halapricum salinum]
MSVDDEFDDPTETTSLDVADPLSEGLDSLLSATGAQLVALLTLVGFGSTVLSQSLTVQVGRDVLEYIRETADMSQPETQEAVAEFERLLDNTGFALDVSIPVLLAGLLVLALVSEAVLIVAVRVFANAEQDGIPVDLATRRLPIATLYGFIGGILLGIAVVFGLLLFIVPGILIFIGTLFFRQEIALADKGPIQAISGTWAVTKGNRWTLLLLVVILWAIGFAIGLVPGFIPGTVGLVLTVLVSSVMSVFTIAVVTDAYVRLSDQPAETDQSTETSTDML